MIDFMMHKKLQHSSYKKNLLSCYSSAVCVNNRIIFGISSNYNIFVEIVYYCIMYIFCNDRRSKKRNIQPSFHYHFDTTL